MITFIICTSYIALNYLWTVLIWEDGESSDNPEESLVFFENVSFLSIFFRFFYKNVIFSFLVLVLHFILSSYSLLIKTPEVGITDFFLKLIWSIGKNGIIKQLTVRYLENSTNPDRNIVGHKIILYRLYYIYIYLQIKVKGVEL